MSRPDSNLEDIRNAFDRAVYGAERRAWIIGLLGMKNQDGTTSIRVPDRSGWVYVTTGPTGGQMVTIARNDGKVPLRDQMPVRMKRSDDGALVIFGVFNAGGFTDSGTSDDYVNNFGVEWHHHRIGSGLEFEMEGLSTERGRAFPTTEMNVFANEFRYYYENNWRNGAGAAIDLASNVPATSGHWAWVVVGVEPLTGILKATTGTSQIYATELTFSQVNDVPFEGVPIVAVKVRNDQTSLVDLSLFTDAHEWFAGLHYSKLGDLDNVNESDGYYGLGPYANDDLYFYGAGGYEWVTGGHKVNMGAVKVHTVASGIIDIGTSPTFGLIDVHGESSADDDLLWIQNGLVGDIVCLFASDFVTNGIVTAKITGNINLEADFLFDSTSKVLVLVMTPSGWIAVDRAGLSAMVTVPKSFEHYVDVKERLLENNVHGGLDVLATAQPLNSVPTDLLVTAGISKLLIAVIAGSDFDGEITVTGTTVDRDTGGETADDTDIIIIDALTTDGAGTDGNGNPTHALTGAYITSKWFKGSVVLSTTNLTLTDVDVYQISFEQFGDVSDISLEAVDITALATNNSAWMDLHLYSVNVTNGKVDIANEGTLELLASEVNSGNRYRKRLGDLSIPLDGTTDGFWFDAFWGPLANIYWEDINAKIWYTQQIDVVGDMVPGYYTNYIDFNVNYEDGAQEGRLQWHIHDGTLEVGMPGGQVNLQIGQEMLLRCRNETGVTIPNGAVVYMTGASGNRPLIDLADSTDPTKIAVLGMATEDIAHNVNGYVNTAGFVRDIDTDGMTEGLPVFLDPAVPGGITQTRPVAPDYIWIMGLVVRAHITEGVVYNAATPGHVMMSMSDVLTAVPADGEILVWNDSNSRFELAEQTGGGGGGGPSVVMFDYLNSSKDSADTPDDEFPPGALNAKWTAVSGSAGTVDFQEAGASIEKYEVHASENLLMMQVGHAGGEKVELRQDFTLADGDSMIAAISPAIQFDGASSPTNNELNFGFSLNTSDVSYDTGDFALLYGDTDTQDFLWKLFDGSSVLAQWPGEHDPQLAFLRVNRNGLDYSFWISLDGASWQFMNTITAAAEYTNFWLVAFCNSASLVIPVPVQIVHWVRQGDNTIFGGWSPNITAGGSGVAALDDLSDVTIDGTPADNELLAFDTGAGEFQNQTAAEAGLAVSGHAHAAGRLNAGAQQLITLSGDTADISSYSTIGFFRIAAESGTADDLATMTAGSDGDIVILKPDLGDTIDIIETGNFSLVSTPRVLDHVNDKFICVWDDLAVKWCELSQAGNE